MRRLAAAVAAIALIAGTASAQAQGQGKGRGGGNSAEAGPRGGGNGGERGNADRGNRGGGSSMAQSMRGSDNAMRGQNDRGQDNAMRDQRGNGGARDDRGNGNAMREDRGGGNAMRDDRGNGNAMRDNRGSERADNRGRGNDQRAVVIDRRDDRRDVDVVRVRDFAALPPRGLIDGCPPGLAKKNTPCVPPGQVRNTVRAVTWDRPDFWGLTRLGDGRYYYDDGYLVRYAPAGGVLGYVPLLGGALSIGNAWPSYYEPLELPGYYERYYGLGPYDSYRYANDVIYRVDPQTAAITSIAALLTGDNFAIGQPMPLGYDIYNVPLGYRDRYVDSPDAYYRYADGYIYQVDPETRLIAAAIELLAS